MIVPDSLAESSLAARRACDELSRQLRSGRDCRAEELLAADPSLAADSDAALELLYTEFVVREQLGQQPRPQAWLDRFPQWRDELAQLFEVHAAVTSGDTQAAGQPDTQRELAVQVAGASGQSLDCPTIGGYEILQEIGRGGMGVVYRARQRGLGRMAAVKMILPPHGERERSRFRAEAEATARLSHPNIVPIYEVGQDGDTPYLSMEFVAGLGLDKLLAEAVLPPRSAAELLHTLARAVAYAHDQGIIHRDLKPANVLLKDEGGRMKDEVKSGSSFIPHLSSFIPKITDFGLAKTLDDGLATAHSVAIVGTPSYMPPEQCSPSGAIGPAVDVYALGAILYEALTGRPPFRGPTALDTLELVRTHEPVPPSRLAAHIPRDLETICLKCLAKQPEQRYASASGLAEDLRRFLADEPILARPVGRTERAARWCRRNPLVAALVGGIALLLISGSIISTSLAVWALREKTRANGHAEQALAARELAEQRLAQAEQAVGKYLDGIENHPRLQEADFYDLRKELLTSAVPFYEEFVASKPGDTELEAKRGRAYGRLGFIRRQLGEHVPATADFERMRDIFAQLQASGVPYRSELARSHQSLALTLAARGLHSAAEAEYRRSLVLYNQLAAESPDQAVHRQRLATGHRNLGLLWNSLGKRAEAEAELREALHLMTALAAEQPAVIEFREGAAGIHDFLAVVLRKDAQQNRNVQEEAGSHHRQAVALWQQLATDFPQRYEHRLGLASARQNLTAFLEDFHEPEAAQAEAEQVLKLRKQLAAEFPTIPLHRRLLAVAHRNLGVMLRIASKLDDSENEIRVAITLLAQLAVDFTATPDHRSELALAHEEQALTLQALDNGPAAEVELRAALPIRQQLAHDFPSIPAHRTSLAKCHMALVGTLLRTNRLAEAEADLVATIELRKQIAADTPNDLDNLRLLTIAQNNLGLALEMLDRRPEAKAVYREALPHWKERLLGALTDPLQISYAARGINNLATLLKRDGELQEARQLYELATTHQLRALQASPTDASLADYQRENYLELAEVCRLLKDHAATARAADNLGAVRPESGDDAHWAARYFGRCFVLSQKDGNIPESERDALARSYAERAMHHLHEAVRRGYQDAAALRKLDALAPLRNRPDFQQLIAELEKR